MAGYSEVYFDKVPTGFLTWTEDIKGYAKVGEGPSPFTWESESQPALDTFAEVLGDGEFFSKVIALWAQESTRGDSTPQLRNDHVQFMKSIGMFSMSFGNKQRLICYQAKTFEDRYLDTILSGMQPLLIDADRYKQRAGAEILVGLLRGKPSTLLLRVS